MFTVIVKKELSIKERFMFFLVSLCLYIFPLMLKNVLYYDDNNRILHGRAYWDVDGRPLTDAVMYLLNFNIGNIGNVAPLPLLLSVIFLAAIFTYISEKINYKKTIWSQLPLLLFVVNPFYLQNFSYQYDCLGMSMGIGCALLAYFYQPKKRIEHIIPPLLIAASFAFYQPCVNVFLALFFADILLKFKIQKNYIKNTLLSAGYYLSGVVIYYIIQFHIITVSTTRNELIKPSELLSSIKVSYEKLSEFLYPLFNSTLVVFFVLFGFTLTLVFLLRMKESICKKDIVQSVLIILSPFALFLCLWGPLLLLKELLFNPREFPAFGVILFTGLLSLYTIDKRGIIYRIISILILIALFSFSYQYANVLKYQRDYDERVFSWLAYDLGKIDTSDKKIYIYGETPRTVLSERIIENNPFISQLVKPSFRWVARAILLGLDIPNVSRDVSFDDEKEWSAICETKKPYLIKHARYMVYDFDSHISVWLLKENKPLCQIKPEQFENIFSKNLTNKIE